MHHQAARTNAAGRCRRKLRKRFPCYLNGIGEFAMPIFAGSLNNEVWIKMNYFTKEELRWLITLCDQNKSGFVEFKHPLYVKIQSIIDNYWLPDNVEIIGTGQLLFHDNHSQSSIISKIEKQLALCENADETKCFRIDWKILYGKKYGQ